MKHLREKSDVTGQMLNVHKAGFTILELLVFSAIFSLVAITFVSILISVTRVQLRETASAEVNQQSQFIMQTIQRYIEESTIVETTSSVPTDALKLRVNPSVDTPGSFALTEIYLDEITPQGGTGKIYVIPKEGDSPQPISSDRVIVTNLTFTKRTHPGAHDSVDINLELHFKSPNPQKQFEQLLQTSIARVSAATFDSDLNPTTSSVFSIGNQQGWLSINNAIYFSGGNLGIHQSNPSYPFVVNAGTGGALFLGTGIYNFEAPVSFNDPLYIRQDLSGSIKFTSGGSLTCSSAGDVGTVRFTDAATDTIEICMNTGSGVAWHSLYYTAP